MIVVVLDAIERVRVVGLLTDGRAVHGIPSQPVTLGAAAVVAGATAGAEVDAQAFNQILDGQLALAEECLVVGFVGAAVLQNVDGVHLQVAAIGLRAVVGCFFWLPQELTRASAIHCIKNAAGTIRGRRALLRLILHVDAQLQILVQLSAHLCMQVHACVGIIGILQHTILVEVVSADEVVHALRTTGDRDGVIGLVAVVLGTFVYPVGRGELFPAAVVVIGVVVEVRVGNPGGLLLVPLVAAALIVAADVNPLLFFPSRQALWHITGSVHCIVAVVGDSRLSLAAALRRHEYNTRGCTGTINSRGRSILQHRDAFDVVGIQQRQIALNTVDEYQSAGGVG